MSAVALCCVSLSLKNSGTRHHKHRNHQHYRASFSLTVQLPHYREAPRSFLLLENKGTGPGSNEYPASFNRQNLQMRTNLDVAAWLEHSPTSHADWNLTSVPSRQPVEMEERLITRFPIPPRQPPKFIHPSLRVQYNFHPFQRLVCTKSILDFCPNRRTYPTFVLRPWKTALILSEATWTSVENMAIIISRPSESQAGSQCFQFTTTYQTSCNHVRQPRE